MKTAILALTLAVCGSVYAQPGVKKGAVAVKSPEERREIMRERIESQKVAYITEKLELTPKEAQKFWPVYNEYKAQMDQLREKGSGFESMGRYAEEDARENEEEEIPMSIEELDEEMSARFERGRKRIDLEEKYYEKYKTVLPAEKVDALYRAERSFRREMMRKMRNRGEGEARGAGEGRGDTERRQMRQREAR